MIPGIILMITGILCIIIIKFKKRNKEETTNKRQLIQYIFPITLIIIGIGFIIFTLTTNNPDKQNNCCTCLDSPMSDVCCNCDNPYLNQ